MKTYVILISLLLSRVVIPAYQSKSKGGSETLENLITTGQFTKIAINFGGILLQSKLSLQAHSPFFGWSISELSGSPGFQVPILLG